MLQSLCTLRSPLRQTFLEFMNECWASAAAAVLQSCSAAVLQCLGIVQILQGRVNVLCMTGDRHVSRAEGAAGTPPGAADTRLMRAVIFVCLYSRL